MQNDEIEKNYKKLRKKLSQIGLTQLTHHSQYEIRIKKKVDFQKKNLAKKNQS